jgi:hypothetical protein
MKKVICIEDRKIAPSMNCIFKDKVYYIHILMNGLCGVYEEEEKREALGLCPEIYFKDICVFRDERIDEIFKD